MAINMMNVIEEVVGDIYLLRPETISEQVVCYGEDGSELRLTDLLNDYSDEIGELNKALEEASNSGFVLRITFDSSFTGQNYTVSGGSFSYTDIVPENLIAIVPVPEPNTEYTVTCSGVPWAVTTSGYFGIYDISVLTFPDNFADATWQQIGAAIEKNMVPETWQIHDTTDIVLATGEVLTTEIIAENHDDLADGSGKARFTFVLKNLIRDFKRMNATAINTNGYSGSELYPWVSKDVLNMLPRDLKSVIKTVKKKTSAGANSATIKTENMEVFLPSEIEVRGANTNSKAGEGTYYSAFSTNADRIKYLDNGAGAATVYFTRSPANNTTQFVHVTASGSTGVGNANSLRGICFMFCV